MTRTSYQIWTWRVLPADADGPEVHAISIGAGDDGFSVRCEAMLAERSEDRAWYVEAYGRPIEGDLTRAELDIAGMAPSLEEARDIAFAAVMGYEAAQKASIVADAEGVK